MGEWQKSTCDIAYSTGLISRLIHRRPSYVCKLAGMVLKYLKGSIGQVLEFRDGGGKEPEIKIYVDASFGPPHEQYRSVQGIAIEHQGNLISWLSTRTTVRGAKHGRGRAAGICRSSPSRREHVGTIEDLGAAGGGSDTLRR